MQVGTLVEPRAAEPSPPFRRSIRSRPTSRSSEQEYLELDARRRKRSGEAAAGADSGGRHRLSAEGALLLRGSPGGSRPAPSGWRDCFRIPGNFCGPANTARCAPSIGMDQARCWSRSAPSRNCRAAIRSRWWTSDNRVNIRPVKVGRTRRARVDRRRGPEAGRACGRRGRPEGSCRSGCRSIRSRSRN